jgi:hypothetical protein
MINSIVKNINSLENCNLTFSDNYRTIIATKSSLTYWVTKDMDRIFFSNRKEAQEFYNSIYALICEFESEHANCGNELVIVNHKMQMLLEFFYPAYTNTLNKYFETLNNLAQNNSSLIASLPNLPIPSPDNHLAFYDRYNDICNSFMSATREYNTKVAEIDKMRTLNHKIILQNSIIQRLLFNHKTTLRQIFNVMHVSRLSIIN